MDPIGQMHHTTTHLIAVDATGEHQRADKFLADRLPDFSRMHIQKAFRDHHVLLNGIPIKAATRLQLGSQLMIRLANLSEPTIEPVQAHLDIIFEDDDVLVVNKSAGQVVHPGHGVKEPTLAHIALYHTHGQLSYAGGQLRPGIVHRLDKETSGLIILAKSNTAYYALTQAFAERTIQKTYEAIVVGHTRLNAGSIQIPIGRHPIIRTKMAALPQGKPARTDWSVIQKFHAFTHLKADLHTGRTHQIRVHFAHMGHVIAGDKTYGYHQRPQQPIADRVLLHAKNLIFLHPCTQQEMNFEAPLPLDMQTFLQALVPQPQS